MAHFGFVKMTVTEDAATDSRTPRLTHYSLGSPCSWRAGEPSVSGKHEGGPRASASPAPVVPRGGALKLERAGPAHTQSRGW